MARSARIAGIVALLCVLCTPAAVRSENGPAVVASLLARYEVAIEDAGAPQLTRYVASGTLSGLGLTGTFKSWHDGDREREDQALGPRTEEVVSLGGHVYLRDSDGAVRELRGVLLRRSRTEKFIDDGTFARSPQDCVYRGTARIRNKVTEVLDVTAPGGQTETLYLDDHTALPVRIAYDDDDGRTTLDFDDWRNIAGHRFPFYTLVSNGDHPFDITQVTTNVQVAPDVAAGAFAVPVSPTIDMSAPQTVPLNINEGHLYVAVQIGGQGYNFLVDTGAANILVDTRIAKALGLKEEGDFQASGATRTGGLHVARLPELTIGDAHLHDLVVSTLDLGGATGGAFRIDGILGYPFFAESMVRIDYANHAMTFGPPGSLPTNGVRLSLELDRALPETKLRLNNEIDGQFVVDTGDSAEVLIYRPFLDRNPGVVPFSTTERHSYGLGGGTSSYKTVLDQLTIGGIPLYHSDVDVMLATQGAFADKFSAGNIGLGVIKNFILTFDDANAALYVEKGAAFDDGRYRYR